MKYKEYVQKVEGKKGRKVFIFTLSTCIWCKKTKKLLRDLAVEFSFVDADLVPDEVSEEIDTDLEKYNPEMNYPTIVVDDGSKVLVGFDEKEIRKTLAE